MSVRSAAFQSAADTLLKESGCTVRKWRTSNSGVAFVKDADWGIEVPPPRGPISFGTFVHEIAHQLLHREGSKPRWLEEVEAWEWALAQFTRFDLPGYEQAQADAAKCLVYAAAKADRRGSPDTARAILDRFPEWVWEADSGCAMTAENLETTSRAVEAPQGRAAQQTPKPGPLSEGGEQ